VSTFAHQLFLDSASVFWTRLFLFALNDLVQAAPRVIAGASVFFNSAEPNESAASADFLHAIAERQRGKVQAFATLSAQPSSGAIVAAEAGSHPVKNSVNAAVASPSCASGGPRKRRRLLKSAIIQHFWAGPSSPLFRAAKADYGLV
jgi:hypothetical protein